MTHGLGCPLPGQKGPFGAFSFVGSVKTAKERENALAGRFCSIKRYA